MQPPPQLTGAEGDDADGTGPWGQGDGEGPAAAKLDTESSSLGSMGSAKNHITSMLKDAELRFHLNNLSNLRRKYDTLKHRVQGKAAHLEELKDQLAELLAEQDQNEECERRLTSPAIQKLQQEYAEASEVVNKVVERRRVLEFMRRRTLADHSRYDAEVQNAKKDLEAAKIERDNHQLLARQEANELRVTKKKLKDFKVHMVATRKQYEEKLARRQAGAEEHTQILELREEMEIKRREIWDAEKDKAAPVVVNRKKMVSNAFKALRIKQALQKEESRTRQYRAQFNKLRRAIGGKDVKEIIERINTSERTAQDLEDMLTTVDKEYSDLQKEKAALDVQMSEIRFSGIGHISKERKMLEEFEAKLRRLQTEVARMEAQVVRVINLNTAVKSGVWALCQRLTKIRVPTGRVRTVDGDIVPSSTFSEVNDTNLHLAVAQCEWKVLRMLDTVVLDQGDKLNILEMLPPETNIMVPTEQEWDAVLEEEYHKELTAAAAGAEGGRESKTISRVESPTADGKEDEESGGEDDREALKAFAEDLRFVQAGLREFFTKQEFESLGESYQRPTLPASAQARVDKKVDERVAQLVKSRATTVKDIKAMRKAPLPLMSRGSMRRMNLRRTASRSRARSPGSAAGSADEPAPPSRDVVRRTLLLRSMIKEEQWRLRQAQKAEEAARAAASPAAAKRRRGRRGTKTAIHRSSRRGSTMPTGRRPTLRRIPTAASAPGSESPTPPLFSPTRGQPRRTSAI